MARLAEIDRRIVDFFNYDTNAAQLFLVLAYLMQRNMMGGLTTYDLMAHDNVRQRLKKSLRSYGDKDVINSLIETLSTIEHKDLVEAVNSESVKYIAQQDHRALCKILATYLPDDIGVLISIPMTENLDIDNMIEQAKSQNPNSIIGLNITPVNPWRTIFEQPDKKVFNNHILIAFSVKPQGERSFYYLKALCMAKAILEVTAHDDEEAAEEVVKQPTPLINKLRIFKGILSISGRRRSASTNKPTSKPFLARTVIEELESDDAAQEEGAVELQKLESPTEEEYLSLDMGFFDVNHGMYFSVRKPIEQT